MLLFRLSGVLLLRLAARTFLGLLFQLPPRITRLELTTPAREFETHYSPQRRRERRGGYLSLPRERLGSDKLSYPSGNYDQRPERIFLFRPLNGKGKRLFPLRSQRLCGDDFIMS